MASVLVPLAQGCEELEAITVVDLLRRAGIDVVTAGLDDRPVRASRGSVLLADMSLEQALQGDYDMVVLPGGLPGADHLDNDERVHDLLKSMAGSGGYTAAICAAPKVLARAGLLQGKRATSYPGAFAPESVPGLEYVDQAVVTDGKVITSRGPGTAMDFALELIETLAGREKRDEVEAALLRTGR
jgi:4-methyl-5(b-hydroxyethyl)-thiazole monophosphate biosynthesis